MDRRPAAKWPESLARRLARLLLHIQAEKGGGPMVTRREEAVLRLMDEPIPAHDRDMSPADELRFAMAIMQYNQAFINFTDGKANALLLINSIFLATSAAAMGSVLSIAAVALAGLAVLLCLSVVYARMPGLMKRDRAKLVFFGHILQRVNRAAYLEDFHNAAAEDVTDSLLKQVYDLARVVDRKFRSYRWAQLATMVSAAAWIAGLLAGANIDRPGGL